MCRQTEREQNKQEDKGKIQNILGKLGRDAIYQVRLGKYGIFWVRQK